MGPLKRPAKIAADPRLLAVNPLSRFAPQTAPAIRKQNTHHRTHAKRPRLRDAGNGGWRRRARVPIVQHGV